MFAIETLGSLAKPGNFGGIKTPSNIIDGDIDRKLPDKYITVFGNPGIIGLDRFANRIIAVNINAESQRLARPNLIRNSHGPLIRSLPLLREPRRRVEHPPRV